VSLLLKSTVSGSVRSELFRVTVPVVVPPFSEIGDVATVTLNVS